MRSSSRGASRMRALLLAALCATLACGKGLGDLEPFACARDQTCPSGYLCFGNLCETERSCNPVSSACTGALPRCTLIASPADATHFVTQCVPAPTGGLREGDACDAPARGIYAAPDACPAGTLCYNEQSAGGAHDALNHCRKVCHAEGDCAPPATHCGLGLPGPQFSALPGGTLGICAPSCDFAGALCPVNQHCDTITGMTAATGVLTCRDNGAVAEGGNCAAANCKNGLVCVPGIAPFQAVPTCRVYCNSTNYLCATGTCETTTYRIGGSYGFCHT